MTIKWVIAVILSIVLLYLLVNFILDILPSTKKKRQVERREKERYKRNLKPVYGFRWRELYWHDKKDKKRREKGTYEAHREKVLSKVKKKKAKAATKGKKK